MSKKAKNCADCQSGEWHPIHGDLTCSKGHKPRFYQPRDPADVSWGWKRRCADFEAKTATT
jgi:hypothetical protein